MGLGLPLWLGDGAVAASNVVAFLTCLLVTAGACALLHTYLTRRALLLDEPNRAQRRTPRAGGLAALLGITCGAVLMSVSGEPVPWAELTAAAVMALMGFMDDLAPQDPALARTFQGTLGAGLGWALGPSIGWLFIGALVGLAVVTTTNLMDGIDGLTAASTIAWGVACAWLGLSTHRYDLTLLGLLAASAALGFLPWNTGRVARLYLGDSGRYLLGAIFAAGILSAAGTDWRMGFLLVMPLSVHLVDVASTWVLERLGHRPTSAPHRERIYQRLSDELGLPHRSTTFVVVGTAVAVTLLWIVAPWYLAMPASILLLALYVDLPRLVARRQGRQHVTPTDLPVLASGGETVPLPTAGGATAVGVGAAEATPTAAEA